VRRGFNRQYRPPKDSSSIASAGSSTILREAVRGNVQELCKIRSNKQQIQSIIHSAIEKACANLTEIELLEAVRSRGCLLLMPGTFVTECGPSPEDYHASAPSSGTGENLPPVQGQSEKLLRDIAAAKRCRKPCRSPSKCAGTWNPPSNSSAIGSIEVGTGVRQVFGKVESPTQRVAAVLEEFARRFGVPLDETELSPVLSVQGWLGLYVWV